MYHFPPGMAVVVFGNRPCPGGPCVPRGVCSPSGGPEGLLQPWYHPDWGYVARRNRFRPLLRGRSRRVFGAAAPPSDTHHQLGGRTDWALTLQRSMVILAPTCAWMTIATAPRQGGAHHLHRRCRRAAYNDLRALSGRGRDDAEHGRERTCGSGPEVPGGWGCGGGTRQPCRAADQF